MKTLHLFVTLLLAFVVFVNANPNYRSPANRDAAFNACLKKLELTKEKLRELEESATSSEDENELYCFVACMHKELGLMNAEGNYDPEAVLGDFPRSIPREDRTKMIDSCVRQKGTDECETARLFHACFKKLDVVPHTPEELKKMLNDCKDELSMTDEEVKKIMLSEDELETNCFGACLMKKVGLLNKDGTFNKTVYIARSPFKQIAERLVDVCAEEVGADECETAARIYKCFKKIEVTPDEFSAPPPRE